jgi:hypothetical protein
MLAVRSWSHREAERVWMARKAWERQVWLPRAIAAEKPRVRVAYFAQARARRGCSGKAAVSHTAQVIEPHRRRTATGGRELFANQEQVFTAMRLVTNSALVRGSLVRVLVGFSVRAVTRNARNDALMAWTEPLAGRLGVTEFARHLEAPMGKLKGTIRGRPVTKCTRTKRACRATVVTNAHETRHERRTGQRAVPRPELGQPLFVAKHTSQVAGIAGYHVFPDVPMAEGTRTERAESTQLVVRPDKGRHEVRIGALAVPRTVLPRQLLPVASGACQLPDDGGNVVGEARVAKSTTAGGCSIR